MKIFIFLWLKFFLNPSPNQAPPKSLTKSFSPTHSQNRRLLHQTFPLFSISLEIFHFDFLVYFLIVNWKLIFNFSFFCLLPLRLECAKNKIKFNSFSLFSVCVFFNSNNFLVKASAEK